MPPRRPANYRNQTQLFHANQRVQSKKKRKPIKDMTNELS